MQFQIKFRKMVVMVRFQERKIRTEQLEAAVLGYNKYLCNLQLSDLQCFDLTANYRVIKQ